MAEEQLVGNLMVAQSGGPTPVINASLAGVVYEALNHECIEEIYGGLNGVLGLLKEDFIDLAQQPNKTIIELQVTPGSALGTCRFKLTNNQDFQRILEVFEAHNIRYFFYIGGNDSQDTADKISKFAQEKNYDLRVIGIPKTIDNDLPVTDHCPGYGSVIKYVATTVREIACDNESMGQHDLVSIVEVMGRNAGWIAAGATLAKRLEKSQESGLCLKSEDAPHMICLPEVPFVPATFIENVRNVLKKQKYCMVVVGEGLIGPDGNYVGTQSTATDAFGHVQLGGIGEYLSQLVEKQLEVKARTAKLGIAQRAASHCSSKTDNQEAFLCGKAAVQAAVAGETDKMVILTRTGTNPYVCTTGLVPLNEVANTVKTIPENFISKDGVSLNIQFYKYALPLIEGEVDVPYKGGVPIFGRLSNKMVKKILSPYKAS